MWEIVRDFEWQAIESSVVLLFWSVIITRTHTLLHKRTHAQSKKDIKVFLLLCVQGKFFPFF